MKWKNGWRWSRRVEEGKERTRVEGEGDEKGGGREEEEKG